MVWKPALWAFGVVAYLLGVYDLFQQKHSIVHPTSLCLAAYGFNGGPAGSYQYFVRRYQRCTPVTIKQGVVISGARNGRYAVWSQNWTFTKAATVA